MQVLLFALGQVICLAFLCYLPFYCAKTDAKEFTDNPAKDNYGKKFHKQRLVWRSVAAGTVVAFCSWPLLPAVPFMALSIVALGAIGAGWFFRIFNSRLSMLRNLSYVDEFYVSFSETTAAFPDKYIANWVMKKYPGEPNSQQAELWRVKAATKLKEMMNQFLLTGVGIYLLSLTFIIIHLF
jgi:hypothetical protein